MMRSAKIYLIFIALTFSIGYTSGVLFPPGAWYQALEKPDFTPPNFLFPIAWTILYILIGIAGARVWISGQLGAPFLLWLTQLGLNGFWSFLFFGIHVPLAALICMTALLLTIIAFIRSNWRFERTTALLFIPYGLWVGFAAVLNASLWWLN